LEVEYECISTKGPRIFYVRLAVFLEHW
jgi:hypothetical protein